MKRNSYKLTPKHFAIFKEEVIRVTELLGLKNYELDIRQEELKNARADFYVSSEFLATIRLAKKWDEIKPTDEEIKLSAKHEVIHLLLHRLYLLAQSRFTTEDEIDRAEHDIVYRLEKVL